LPSTIALAHLTSHSAAPGATSGINLCHQPYRHATGATIRFAEHHLSRE